jgi:hypothetical protein
MKAITSAMVADMVGHSALLEKIAIASRRILELLESQIGSLD